MTRAAAKKTYVPQRDYKKDTGYRFIDKDAGLDIGVQLLKNSGVPFSQISERSGVSVSTLHAWDTGKTKRCLRLTMAFALDAIGVDMVYRERDSGRVHRIPIKPK